MKKGFTLIETIVAILVFSLSIIAVTGLISKAYKVQTYSNEQSKAIEEARRGIETMVKEIREARIAENGAYIIEKADDFEFVFYSDIDKDQKIERVRYFIGGATTGSDNKECVTFDDGGSCSVNFSDFFSHNFDSAQVKVSVEGDFGSSHEKALIYADGVYLGEVCSSGCSDCAGEWEGHTVFDVSSQAEDNFIQFTAEASGSVNDFCDWQDENHSMKVKFEFSWTATEPGQEHNFRKGVIEPVGWPPEYPQDQEEIFILSQYVRNSPPIFKYFDKNGNQLPPPARLASTTLMKVYLVINVEPNRLPDDFELSSEVQIRNLKTNL